MTLRRIVVHASIWLGVLAVAGAASMAGISLVFPHRTAFTLLVAAAAVAVGAAARRRVPTLALSLVVAVTLWKWASPHLDARAVWADLPDARVAGRHFVVGYTDVAEVRALSRAGLIGGVFLTRRNVERRSADAVAAEIGALQAERRDAGLPPLVVAGDQEGGPVAHLSPPLPPVPALSRLAVLPTGERRDAARRDGEDAGRALAALGVTMDFAPVADLRPATARDALDLHTRIATRAISDDPAAVAEIASGFAEGLLGAGVTPTAKHFPGLGAVATDTHLFGAALTRPRDALDAADWRPFRALMALRGSAVMLSHAALEAVDAGVPASQSRAVVAGLLRHDWGFDGVAVTDDLTMGGAVGAGLCRAVERSLDAGVDLLLVSWDTDRVYPALRCAADAARAGRLDRAALAASALRLDALTARADGPTSVRHPRPVDASAKGPAAP